MPSDDPVTHRQQVSWGGNADPAGLLEPGKTYAVDRIETHSWHSKVFLVDHPSKPFNSVHFDEAE